MYHYILIKYAISKNFDLTIGKIDDSIDVPEHINKLNFLGNICLYNSNSQEIYDAVYINELDTLTSQQFEKNLLIILKDKIITFLN